MGGCGSLLVLYRFGCREGGFQCQNESPKVPNTITIEPKGKQHESNNFHKHPHFASAVADWLCNFLWLGHSPPSMAVVVLFSVHVASAVEADWRCISPLTVRSPLPYSRGNTQCPFRICSRGLIRYPFWSLRKWRRQWKHCFRDHWSLQPYICIHS